MRNKEDSSSSSLKLYLIHIKILVRLVKGTGWIKAYNQLKTMIKVSQVVMDILRKKWGVADLEEWFHLVFWAYNRLMLGHPEFPVLEIGTTLTPSLTPLLFVAATPA